MAAVCPRCAVPLLQGHSHTGVVHGCSRCGGVWVDTALVARVCAALDVGAVQLAESVAAYATQAVDLRSALGCPACGQALHRHLVPGTSVEVDTCSAHGTWFDRHELRALAHVAAAARGVAPPAAAGHGGGWGAYAATTTAGPPRAAGTGAVVGAAAVGAAAVGAAAVGAAAVGAYAMGGSGVAFPAPHQQEAARSAWGDVVADVGIEGGLEVAELAVDGAEVVADAAEAGFSLLGFLAELF